MQQWNRSKRNGGRAATDSANALLAGAGALRPGARRCVGGRPAAKPDARHNADTQKTVRAQIAVPSFPAPFAFSAAAGDAGIFAHGISAAKTRACSETMAAGSEAAVIDAPMLRDTSIARELSEAKTQDRVRLLTLWQSRASSFPCKRASAARRRCSGALRGCIATRPREDCLTDCLPCAAQFRQLVPGGARAKRARWSLQAPGLGHTRQEPVSALRRRLLTGLAVPA